MKIAMLIDGWNPIFGGGQVHVKELCNGLINNHGVEVHLFTRKLKDDFGKKYIDDEIFQGGKLKIFRIGPTTKFFNIFGRVFSLINTTIFLLIQAVREKYDIIHAHAYVSGLPAIIVGKILKIPVVYTVHGANILDTEKKGIFGKIEKWLLTGIKYDLEISVGRDFLKYDNVNNNIKIIPNGVDINKFDNVKVSKKYEGINFLRVGRFSWEKGIEYLVKGIGLVDKKILINKGFKLNLVGDGEDKDKIIKLVKELKLEKFIVFKGKLFGEELIKEYKKNHIFILPSLTEGFGIVLLEAMISGLITVATKCGGPEDIISDKKNGFLINKGNISELHNIILNFIFGKFEYLDTIRGNGYQTVANKYTWNIVVVQTYYEYKTIVNVKKI